MTARKQQRRGKCKTKGCVNVAQQRGVCQPCWREVEELIESGQYTEKQLLDLGVIDPAKKPGRKRANRVLAALKGKGAA